MSRMLHRTGLLLTAGLLLSAPAIAAQSLPFSGSFTNGGGSGPMPIGGRCAPAFTITWDPVAYPADYTSNYGDFTRAGTECVVPPQPTTSFDGEFTLDFGSGTTLYGTRWSEGFATPTRGVFDLVGHWTITGGTGLFADAIGGSFTETAVLSPPRGIYAGGFEGSVLVPAPAMASLFGLGALAIGVGASRRRG